VRWSGRRGSALTARQVSIRSLVQGQSARRCSHRLRWPRLSRAGVDVPGDVSVVGYDDSPLSRLTHIDLTTVSQNPQQLAEYAVTTVLERLDGGRAEHREVVVAPRLVVRGTTAPVPDLTTPG
jgi:hypothetical protein